MLSSVACEWNNFALKSIIYEGKDIIYHRHCSTDSFSFNLSQRIPIPPSRPPRQPRVLAQLRRIPYCINASPDNFSEHSCLWPLELVQKPIPERTRQQKQSDSTLVNTNDCHSHNGPYSPIHPPRSKQWSRSLALCHRNHSHGYRAWSFLQTSARTC